MAEHSSRLHLDWRHFSDRLHVQIVFGEFILDVIVLCQNDHLNDDIGLLLSTQSTIQRVQFTDSEETLKRKYRGESVPLRIVIKATRFVADNKP